MNIDELAQKLEKMFNSGENKNAMTQLFMIIYYDEIDYAKKSFIQ